MDTGGGNKKPARLADLYRYFRIRVFLPHGPGCGFTGIFRIIRHGAGLCPPRGWGNYRPRLMNNILIVGGAGYIGSHANKLLSKKGFKTVVFDNLSTGNRELSRWGEFVKGDLKNPADLLRCFKKRRISAVMHFAACAYVGESVTEPAKYYRNNVANTLNLLDAMRAAGVKKIIFSSSAATFGVPSEIPITETHPQSPINPYGRTKLMMEQIIADYAAAYGLEHVFLRYFNAAGADTSGEIGEIHHPETHLIPLILDAAAGTRKDIKVFGTDYPTKDGTCVRDYVHVSDLAEAHALALDYLVKSGKSGGFNLGNGRGFSVREVIETARKVTGKAIKATAAPRRPGDPPVLIASSARAGKILGWRPALFDLDTIIKTAWAWHERRIP